MMVEDNRLMITITGFFKIWLIIMDTIEARESLYNIAKKILVIIIAGIVKAIKNIMGLIKKEIKTTRVVR